MASDWTDEQNNAIVADYFAMLAADIVGRPYSKAEHNRHLQASIGRPRGSIEYKHQNISAVLKGLGEDWIQGYKPAFNFQASLVDAVVRWLSPSHWSRLNTVNRFRKAIVRASRSSPRAFSASSFGVKRSA